MKAMWPFRKKSETKKNTFHGVDLEVWEYLGSTEIKWNSLPSTIYFFSSKIDQNERNYILSGRPKSVLTEISQYHTYVSDKCELWRIGEFEFYHVIMKPSKFLKNWMFTNRGCVWNIEKKWWTLASEQDRYDHSVAQHRKKHPEIYTEDNIVTVNFKPKE